MSFIVKGVKIPESCHACDMLELSGAIGCKHAYDTKNSECDRAQNCPLYDLSDIPKVRLSSVYGSFHLNPQELAELKECYLYGKTHARHTKDLNESKSAIIAGSLDAPADADALPDDGTEEVQ